LTSIATSAGLVSPPHIEFVTHFDKIVASSEVLRDFFAFDVGHGQNQHKERSGVVVFVATISPVPLVRHGLVRESVEAIKEELVEVVQCIISEDELAVQQ
jgi:hypothetical protein